MKVFLFGERKRAKFIFSLLGQMERLQKVGVSSLGGGVEIGGRSRRVAKTRVPVSKIPCNIVTESEACPLFRFVSFRSWREAARRRWRGVG